jgi:outer membrane receptor protein involved in Fe transport
VRTFVNLTSGTIQGLELDGFFQLLPTVRLSWGGQWLEGEADVGSQLADIPADRVHVGGRWQSGHWSARGRLQHRFEKDQPGPGEVALDSAQLLSASVAYAVRDGFDLVVSGDNLLDETYLPSADDRSVPAPERSFGVSVRWTD